LLILAPGAGQVVSQPRQPVPVDAVMLISLERRVERAMVAGETRFLSEALSNDFQFTHADGAVETKWEVIRLTTQNSKYYLRRDVLNPTVEQHGGVALVSGNLDVFRGPMGDEHRNSGFCYALNFIHVFVMRSRRWWLFSYRTTQLTKAETAFPAVGL